MRLLELPTAMRDHGVDVVEVAGWQQRGRDFPRAPIGGIDHWTVGAAVGEAPSLAVVTYGRSDLPGPLCHVLRGRWQGQRRPRAFMVAAGVANHAGAGELVTSSGRVADSNVELFGLEVEYRPYGEPIRDDDLAVDAAVHAAAAEVCGYRAVDVVGHWQYGRPFGRKVDRKTVRTAHLQQLIELELVPEPPTTKGSDDMVDDIERLHVVYLGADPDPRRWDRAMLRSFDYHLEWYANGRPLGAIRGDFARTAGL